MLKGQAQGLPIHLPSSVWAGDDGAGELGGPRAEGIGPRANMDGIIAHRYRALLFECAVKDAIWESFDKLVRKPEAVANELLSSLSSELELPALDQLADETVSHP